MLDLFGNHIVGFSMRRLKCQFHLLTTSIEMFETPGLLSCYLPDCNISMQAL